MLEASSQIGQVRIRVTTAHFEADQIAAFEPCLSAAKCVADGRADPSHDIVADSAEGTDERCLGDGVKAVAVDD